MTTLHDPILGKHVARKSIGVEHTAEPASSSGPSSLVPESLSSASSFQSLSSKSSSGICADSAPESPDKTALLSSSNADTFDHSYVNLDIPDLDDLISACANINLGGSRAQYRDSPDCSAADLSQDQTFASAADDTIGDVTQILVEETIQTFKTCPGLETQPSENIFKDPLPIDTDSKSAIIPYVSFEQSVLRQNQEAEDQRVALLKADSPRRRSYSPTPCVEIDVAQLTTTTTTTTTTATGKNNNSFLSAEDGSGQKVETSDGFSTPDVSFQEVDTFNSTIPLNTDDNKSAAKTTENLNVTPFVSVFETVGQNQNVITTSDKVVVNKLLNKTQDVIGDNNVVNKTEEILKDIEICFNKTQEIANEENLLNTVQTIVGENYSLNSTQEIAKENVSLNKTQEIVKEDNRLNKTQNIVDENDLNKTEEITKENISLNKTQDIVEEDNCLNRTQNIVDENDLSKTQEVTKENISLNKTQDIIKEENLVNRTQEIGKEENLLNKTQEIIKEVSFNKTQEIVKEESFLTKTQDTIKDITSETNKVQNTLPVTRKEPTAPSIVESASEHKNKLENFKEPYITVKTPSKLYEKRELTPPNLETFCPNELQNSNEIVSSTPLHWKKEEKQKTPTRKSGLFNKELKSPLQLTSPPSLNKNFNSPSKDKATKEQENKVNFDQTVAVNRSFEKSSFSALELLSKNSSLDLLPTQEPDYEAFKPQQQSTTLPFAVQCPDFEALQEAALSVAKDIDQSLEKIEEEPFISATTELFGDPSALDFLTQVGSQTSRRGERYDSLYMRFDPLAERQSMLPQKNLPGTPTLEEEEEQREIKVNTSIGNAGTPKKNPALAAIDRLLFYSPCPPATTDSEKVEAKQKLKEEAEKKEAQAVPIVNEEMAKELELVRSTVVQLETELEKRKQEHEKQLEKQRVAYDERVMQIQAKFGQMQSQLSQETKCKDQMTVVVEEYEKSISRLIAEREKEKVAFTQERDRIKAELDISQQHLANSEAAFTDVHAKYERLKSVVTAYKSNEEVLKESIAENQETIKTLENRYEQLKSHAMAQLEKANLELSAIKKQHEADVLKLKAMVRKTELRCKTLEETVEQKTKENKELTQIIDEMIARVD
ncbi:transforming acidic coiled-coil-containing protein 3-like isoform X2 [Phymastichus coffea]|uniref:transforming acidic coiled-coil-containing protein 3-like isoform X2 n=1 Tax=Phymastichus coffea TaxID=108790 RepID=UPI00273C6210|nr:transforming acidic coiled-coil-containing protein 3-like isoform X2 [Phymastichus coffea]